MNFLKKWLCGKQFKQIDKIEETLSLCSENNAKSNQTIEGLKAKVTALIVSRKGVDRELADLKKSSDNVQTFIIEPIVYENPKKINHTAVHKTMNGAVRMTLLDAYTYGIDKEDVQRIINQNPNIKDMKYIVNDLDCDDFAIALYGLFNQQTLGRFAFALVRSKGHAFNAFIDRKEKLWIVEPQTGQIMTHEQAEKSPMDYKITQYLM